LEPLDNTKLGYGYDPFLPGERRHYPMAYGLIASAEANRYHHTGHSNAKKRACAAAEWLYQNRDRDNDGRIGWGLPFAWDAFGDDSMNPRHHVYTITSALSGRGLLDVVQFCGLDQQTCKNYIRTVQAVADRYIQQSLYNSYNTGICFWYSTAKRDSDVVYNPAAMFAALLQRLAAHNSVPESSQEVYDEYANRQMLYIINESEMYNDAVVWRYYGSEKQQNPNKYNDSVHAAYMVDALMTYGNYNGKYKNELNQEGMRSGLELFKKNNELYRYFDGQSLARIWGLGHLLYVLSRYYPESNYLEFLIKITKKYYRNNKYMPQKNPTHRGFGAVRHTAHILNGISNAEFSNP